MTPESLQPILSELFGDAVGAMEVLAQTDRGPLWAFSLTRVVGLDWSGWDGWERLREALAEHEYWPLLVAGWRHPRDVAKCYAHSSRPDPDSPFPFHSARQLLRQGLDLDVDEWLRSKDEKQARFRAEHEAWLRSQGYAGDEEEANALTAKYDGIEARHRAWLASAAGAQAQADEDGHSYFDEETNTTIWYRWGDYSGTDAALHEVEIPEFSEIQPPRVPEVAWMILVPARHGWQVPAVLHFGGWNACLAPHIHVALARRWQQKYGAQLDSLSHDMIGFRVPRPLASREEALQLAREHIYFCEDITDHSTLEEHADWLVGRSGWSFWWD